LISFLLRNIRTKIFLMKNSRNNLEKKKLRYQFNFSLLSCTLFGWNKGSLNLWWKRFLVRCFLLQGTPKDLSIFCRFHETNFLFQIQYCFFYLRFKKTFKKLCKHCLIYIFFYILLVFYFHVAMMMFFKNIKIYIFMWKENNKNKNNLVINIIFNHGYIINVK
jgi:hypothetical protein